MKLGVNIIRLTRKFTGVGRYIECILKEWSRMDIPFDQVTLYAHSPIEQDQVVFPLNKFKLEWVGPKVPDPLWEWKVLNARAKDLDVLFCPSYTAPMGYRGRCVVTNLGPPENIFPSYEWWRSQAYEQLYKYSAHRADRVLACSHSVKKRLVSVYHVPEDKIDVTFLAPSEVFRPIEDEDILNSTKRKYIGDNSPYILFVGKMARRHYIPNLLQAFAQLKKDKSLPHKLLLVGPDYLNLNIAMLAKRAGIGNSVVHVPYVQHLELPVLYNAAEIFVFPASEAEGFGIPVAEAMACGTPVITVARGSLLDFAVGAAHLVKDSSVEQLKSGLLTLLFSPSLQKILSKKGIERARSITWRKSAEITMNILHRVALA